MGKISLFSNKQIADLFDRVAVSYEILGENKFRVSAYQRAAVSIEHLSREVKDLWDDQKLDQIPGVGKNLAEYLDEFFKTGQVKYFNSVFKKIPPSVFIFIKLPGIGSKTALTLAEKLGIKSEKFALLKLKKAANMGKIRKLPNFGEKSENDILLAIDKLKKNQKDNRMLLIQADQIVGNIILYLKNNSLVIEAQALGSIRRRQATIGDIDIAISTTRPKEVMAYLLKYDQIKEVIRQGEEQLVSVNLKSGQQVDFRFSRPENQGSMLQYFTGSKLHNIKLREYGLKKGLSLSEYGIKRKNNNILKNFSKEDLFYQYLGLKFIPPELREGTNEIQLSEKSLPSLVETKDILGDLHLHSNFNIEPSHDLGESSLSEMFYEAKKLNYQYLGFSEHNPSVSQHTIQQVEEIIKRKKEYTEQEIYSFNKSENNGVNKLPIKVLTGLEIDIKPDGSLGLDPSLLKLLDYAIVSVHTSFDQDREKMTKRIINGLSHSKVKILGHPTGQKIQEREGYELDWDKIFAFCLENKKILEINSWPNRLDLPELKVKEAVKYGVMLIINSDSHNVNQMKYLEYGVNVARRGWAEKNNIVNTFKQDDFLRLISS